MKDGRDGNPSYDDTTVLVSFKRTEDLSWGSWFGGRGRVLARSGRSLGLGIKIKKSQIGHFFKIIIIIITIIIIFE